MRRKTLFGVLGGVVVASSAGIGIYRASSDISTIERVAIFEDTTGDGDYDTYTLGTIEEGRINYLNGPRRLSLDAPITGSYSNHGEFDIQTLTYLHRQHDFPSETDRLIFTNAESSE